MKNRIIISKEKGSFTELIHRDSDPGMWIVRHWKRSFLFKKLISSDWFNGRDQALKFADSIKEGTHIV